MKANRVRLNHDDLIEVVYVGDQTRETVSGVNQAGKALADRLRRRGEKVLVLANLEGVGRSDVYARKEAANALKYLDYDRIAAYGASSWVGKAVSLLIRAVDRGEKIKVFSSRKEAVDWLFGLTNPGLVKTAGQETGDDYRQYVKHKIDELNDVISLATIGEYAGDIEMPADDDEFADTFAGIKLLIDTLEEKSQKIRQLQTMAQPDENHLKKPVFFSRKLPSPHG